MSTEGLPVFTWNSSCGDPLLEEGSGSLCKSQGHLSTVHHQGLLVQAIDTFPSGPSVLSPGTQETNLTGN